MHDFDGLKRLVALPTPTGFEYDGMKLLGRSLKDSGVTDVSLDCHGNLIAVLNRGAPVRVMLEGHCDEIGFMVQYIDEDGFLYMCPLGGVTVPLVAAERIVIRGKKGPVAGVFGVRPPHLMSMEERKNVAPAELKNIKVDIGASSREEAEELVELGSPAVVDAGWRALAGDRVSCRGFDNRIGAYIVTEVAKRLAGKKLAVELNTVASVQEEVGLIGGYTTAFNIKPHIGICVDVTFATDAQKEDCKTSGDIKVGAGPVLGIGPTYHKQINALLMDAAAKKGVKFQKQVRARGNGTCAFAMRTTAGGAAVAQVSIPLRYMHSPVEVISLGDAEAIIDVLAEAIASIPADLKLCDEL